MQKAKNKNEGCKTLYCENEGETTRDRQKWKEELDRYSRKKCQDERKRMKARKELDDWEESIKRQRERAEGHRAPKLMMSVVMRSRASFSNEKAVGVDGI